MCKFVFGRRISQRRCFSSGAGKSIGSCLLRRLGLQEGGFESRALDEDDALMRSCEKAFLMVYVMGKDIRRVLMGAGYTYAFIELASFIIVGRLGGESQSNPSRDISEVLATKGYLYQSRMDSPPPWIALSCQYYPNLLNMWKRAPAIVRIHGLHEWQRLVLSPASN